MIVDVTGGVIPVPVVWSPSYKHALRLPIFHQQTNEVNKMEYLIAFSVVTMMALYTLIIARCLEEPEWQ